MKVVMVVDIPIDDYTTVSELNFLANINIFPGVTSTMYQYEYENVVVRPLPQKKGISLKEAIGIKCSCYSDGWNECLDEITGENE